MENALKHNSDLPWPWRWLSVDRCQHLETELKREIARNKKHPLYGLHVRALADRRDMDDVLFEVDNGSFSVALVHLTQNVETDPRWPHTKGFQSFEEWVAWARDEKNQ